MGTFYISSTVGLWVRSSSLPSGGIEAERIASDRRPGLKALSDALSDTYMIELRGSVVLAVDRKEKMMRRLRF